jgi:hypothetical protein
VRNAAHCLARAAAGWLVLALAAGAAGCAAPQYTYVADSAASTYFKVPYGWHKIASPSLAAQFKGVLGSPGAHGVWDVAYDAAATPSAAHVTSPDITQPFAFALVFPLSPAASNAMSYNGLRDLVLPVTQAARQAAAAHGFPLSHFRLLRDSVLTPGQGIHGVRVTFDYTYPDGSTDTFDQVALTNATDTRVYLLVVHCLAACYRQHYREINTVMTSFTVRSP